MANVFNVLTKFTAKDQTSPTLKTISSGAEKLSLTLGVAGIAATKLALDFDKGITKAATIIDTNVLPISKMRKEVLRLSDDTGVSATEIAAGLYEVGSASIAASKSIDYLTIATNTARVGYADTGETVRFLSSLMTAYGDSVGSVQEMSSKLLMTQDLAKTDVGQLSASLGRVITSASQGGVALDDLLSSMTVLTQTQGTAESVTSLSALIGGIGKATPAVLKQIDALNTKMGLTGDNRLDFSYSAIRAEGFINVLKKIQNVTGGDADLIKNLFGSKEAVTAIASLTSSTGLAKLADSQAKYAQGLDTYTEKLKIVENSDSERVKKAMNNFKNLGIVIGLELLPPIARFASFLSEKVLPIFQNMNPTLLKVIVGIAAVAGVVSTGIVLFGTLASSIAAIIPVVTTLTPAFVSLSAAMSANPIGIIIVAVGALAAGIVYLITETEGLGNAFLAVGKQILKGFLLPNNLSFYAVTKLIRAMSHIPKMGFLGGVADSMEQAQNSINQTLTGSSSFVSDKKNLKEAFDGVKWKDSEEQAITSAAATSKHTSKNNAILDINLNDVAGSLESVKMGGSLGDTKVSLNNGWQ